MQWHFFARLAFILLILALSACAKYPSPTSDGEVGFVDTGDSTTRVFNNDNKQKSLEEIISLGKAAEENWINYKPITEQDAGNTWYQHSLEDHDLVVDEKTGISLISFQRFYFEDKYVDRINLSSDMLFGFDSSNISSATRSTFSQVATTFKYQLESQYIFVVGHTDSVGTDAYNIKLSARRAAAVVAMFKENNIPSKNIAVIPAGKHVPRAPNDTASNRAKNRRVELYVSPWQKMPLRYLQDISCPDNSCTITDLAVLTVDRDYKLSAPRLGSNLPVMISAMQNSRTRQSGSLESERRQPAKMTVIIRTDRVNPVVRTFRLQ